MSELISRLQKSNYCSAVSHDADGHVIIQITRCTGWCIVPSECQSEDEQSRRRCESEDPGASGGDESELTCSGGGEVRDVIGHLPPGGHLPL